MYSGVAEPASPASTSAASPGARCTSAKVRTTMVRIVGTASARRRTTYRKPLALTRARPAAAPLLCEPRLVEGRVQPQRAHEPVLHLLVVNGHEVELENEHDRARLHDLLLELVVERRALLRIGLDRRLVHELVGLGRAPARAVDEHRAGLDRLRMVQPVHADHRIGQRLDPVVGEFEVVVGVHPAQPGRNVLVAQAHLDPELSELLLDVLAEAPPLLAIGRDVVNDLEARTAGAALVAGLVEELFAISTPLGTL